ncbi:hypothetical protein SAMN05444004_1292 [Jannaschia faecimaris]|uniref:Uncharacterized protein n=1 Tax=Jannaschia faecimaris TaxID=1244108 RepID=A0A1H3UC62_9RHOB|nr:hypothetical protein SAMN05444004_1292 [Jannaschia faecimaris]
MLPLHRGVLIFAALGLVRAMLLIAVLAAALLLQVSPMAIAAVVAGFIFARLLLTRAADPGVGAIIWR